MEYGYSTDESTWTSKSISANRTFDSSLKSYFVRLTGLNADSAVYHRVCDTRDGCGQRFWFKTAPTDNSSFVVAGGDTRTGWDTCRAGNKLVAKIRPLFIRNLPRHAPRLRRVLRRFPDRQLHQLRQLSDRTGPVP